MGIVWNAGWITVTTSKSDGYKELTVCLLS